MSTALQTTSAKTDSVAGADTRERILRVALAIIGEQGIAAISNRLLAKRAGVALGSLTYHFPSQTDLLRESLMLYVSEEVTRLGGIADELRRAKPSVDRVAMMVSRVAASTPESGVLGELELHLQAARDPQLREASRRCFEAYDDVAVAALQALEIPDPERHATKVVAIMTGFAMRAMSTGEYDADGLTETLVLLSRGAGK